MEKVSSERVGTLYQIKSDVHWEKSFLFLFYYCYFFNKYILHVNLSLASYLVLSCIFFSLFLFSFVLAIVVMLL